MATIVEQIQRDALDPAIPVSALLRRVKFASVKLGLGQVEDWVNHELNGYPGEVPDYRMVHGQVRVLNPYRGWMPLLGNPQLVNKLSVTRGNQPIAAIEELLGPGKDEFLMDFAPHIVDALNKTANFQWPRYALHIDRGSLVKIVDRVRTLVLDWALDLERAGIFGNEFTFTPAEKRKAQEASVAINIGNIGSFAGNLGAGNSSGDITASDIQVDQVRKLAEETRQHVEALVANGADHEALGRSLSAIEKEVDQPSPDRGALRGYLTDLRNAVSGAAGNLIASGVLTTINQILGTGVPSP